MCNIRLCHVGARVHRYTSVLLPEKNNNKNHLKLNKTKRNRNNINAPERYWCAALAMDDAVSVGFPLPTDVTAIRLRDRIIIVFRRSDKSCGCVSRNFSEVKY